MTIRTVTKCAGWAIVVCVLGMWAAGLVDLGTETCTYDCRSPFEAIILGLVLASVPLAVAASLLAHGYGSRDGTPAASTPAAVAAKLARVTAVGALVPLLLSPLLALYDLRAAIVATVFFGLVSFATWQGVRSLDATVESPTLSPGRTWAVALGVLGAVVVLTIAAGARYL